MKRVAVITARGGSKRLERKNIRPFHGRPIIHYAIELAKQSGLFDQVMVSTEDQEIRDVACEGGVDAIIDRPRELADDHATTGQVMKHAVEVLLNTGETDLEHVACIYPCTPLAQPQDLQDGFTRLTGTGKSYVVSVAEYAPQIHRALLLWDDSSIRPVWPNLMQVRTQDLDKRYHDAGQWYIGKKEAWLAELPILDGWSVGQRIPRVRAVDIDTLEDWQLAEALYEIHIKGRRP